MAMMTAQPLLQSAAREAQARKERLPRAGALYALYAAALCAALWPTPWEMAGTWLSSSTYHHCFLVAPVALWMIGRSGVPKTPPRASVLALPFLAAAAFLWLVGRAARVNIVEEIGFVSLLIAGVPAIFGAAHARRWAFPLAFLFFMVPFGAALSPALQQAAAQGAAALLSASGVSVSVDGVMLTTPVGPFEIAEACAGINFLLAAAMVAAVYSWMSFASWKKAAAFFGFAIALALAANVIRVYVVILAAILTEGRYAISADHIVFGWFFYGMLLFLLVAIGRRIADRRAPLAPNPADERMAPARPEALTKATLISALVILGATGAYGRLVMDRAPRATAPTALPFISAPGWLLSAPPPDWRASLEHADRQLYAAYQSGTARIFLATGYFTHDRRNAEIAGYETRAYEKPQWRKIDAKSVSMTAFGANRIFRVETIESLRGARLGVITIYWLEGRVFGDPRALKIEEARQRLLGRNPRGGVIFIAAAREEADAAIAAFLKSAEPLDAWLARIDAKASN